MILDHLKPPARALRAWRAQRESKWTLAGALVFDPDGRLLLLQSRQRGEWEYPAGAVDGAESPLEGARREVAEEVGLRPAGFTFIGVDFFDRPNAPNGAVFFTFAAAATATEAAGVRLQALEATAYRWVTRAEALELIAPRLRDRLAALLDAHDAGRPVYLHTGHLDPVR